MLAVSILYNTEVRVLQTLIIAGAESDHLRGGSSTPRHFHFTLPDFPSTLFQSNSVKQTLPLKR